MFQNDDYIQKLFKISVSHIKKLNLNLTQSH